MSIEADITAQALQEIDGLVTSLQEMVDLALEKGETGLDPHVLAKTLDVSGPTPAKLPKPKLVLAAVLASFNEAREKRHAMRSLGREFRKKKEFPLCVAVATEAWISEQSAAAAFVQPRDDPNRREGLVVFASTFDKSRRVVASRTITRDGARMVPAGHWHLLDAVVETSLLDYFFAGWLGVETLEDLQ